MEQVKDAAGEMVFLHPLDQNQGPSLPPLPSVARPDLVRRIEEAMSGRLVLVTAPAGWGKTSLLAEWAHSTGYRVAWVSCEGVNGDTRRFLRAVVSALESVCAGIGADIYPMLRSARPIALEQELAAIQGALLTLPRPTVIVLDDFHLIDDPDVLQGVWQVATSGPPQVRFLIAGRAAPSWPLARLRAYGDVTEFGAKDLAFSDEETIVLLGAECADHDLARVLQQRAEGWVAGLRLAKLWLRSMEGLSAVEASFQGSHRDVADYLAEEVLRHLRPEVERFLMLTSVLERFSAPLASAVTGSDGAATIIEEIEQQGLFVVPLDHERQWYRYHGIFRQFLRARLARSSPAMVAEVWRRAARWYEDAGHPVEAAHAYLNGDEPVVAAELIGRVAEPLLLRDGETMALIQLVERLPREFLSTYPTLSRYYTWALVLVGRLDDAEAMARSLEARIGEADRGDRHILEAEVASIRARLAAYRGDHEATIAYAETALECAGESLPWVRADAWLSLGFAYRAIGRTVDACDAFGQASRLGWEGGFAHAALWGARYGAVVRISQGNLRDAEILIERDIERAQATGMDQGPAFAALILGRGEIRYERNQREEARQDISRALELAHRVGDAKILMNVYVALALLEDSEGHHAQAQDAVRRAVAVFDGTGEKAVEAWLALRHQDDASVRRWMDDYIREYGARPLVSGGESEQTMLGRAMLVLGDTAGGTSYLRELLAQSEAAGRHGRAMVVKVLLAASADAAGDEGEAAALARDVIDLALREGFVRSILDEGPAFLRLLRRVMRREASSARREYLSMLFSDTEVANGNTASPQPNGLVERLTPRQEEVLQLMIEGQSNREIAEALFLSEGTVKAHVHQIFGKLMVRNRAEAIRAARELDLTG